MIVTEGKIWIKRYMASQVGTIANSIAVGSGSVPVNVDNVDLDLEIFRVPVTTTAFDFLSDEVIFKGEMPADFSGKIYEVGIFSGEADSQSKMLVSFDSDDELWTTPVWNSTNARVGTDSLRQAPGVSTTVTNTISDIFLDLTEYSDADRFQFAYYVNNPHTASVSVRFQTDAAKYYTFQINNPLEGYNITPIIKNSAVVTGTPSWDNINSVMVRTTSKATGSAIIDWDAIRVQDVDNPDVDNVLIARQVLDVPTIKEESRVQDIEFRMAVTV